MTRRQATALLGSAPLLPAQDILDRRAPEADAVSLRWQEALPWLPPETETLLVVTQPFEVSGPKPAVVTDEDEPKSLRAAKLVEWLQALACTLVDELPIPFPSLIGARIAYAVCGVTRFHEVRSMGMGPVTSLSLIRLEKPSALFEAGVHRIEHVSGSVDGVKANRYTWFAMQPEPDLLVVSSTEDFTQNFTSRRTQPAPASPIPVSHEAWRYVDSASPAFSIRLFQNGAGMDRELVDVKARFLVVNANRPSSAATVYYATANPAGLKMVKALWLDPEEQNFVAARLTSQVWRLQPHPDTDPSWMLRVISQLGYDLAI